MAPVILSFIHLSRPGPFAETIFFIFLSGRTWNAFQFTGGLVKGRLAAFLAFLMCLRLSVVLCQSSIGIKQI